MRTDCTRLPVWLWLMMMAAQRLVMRKSWMLVDRMWIDRAEMVVKRGKPCSMMHSSKDPSLMPMTH